MSFDAWPSPDSRRGPLPRIEDLPVAEQGYEQEAVRRAFDDFYRHAAQLDASLKALEAVEAFRRDAAELRSDLRSLRALGLGGGSEPSWAAPTSWTYEQPRPELSAAALRIAAEAALLIAVGVIAGVSHLRAWVIVALMGAALVVVWLSEWLAARARTRVPASLYEPVAYAEPTVDAEGEPAAFVEAPVLEQEVGWSAFEAAVEGEPVEDTEEDASPPEPVAEEARAEEEREQQEEQEPQAEAAESPDEPEAEAPEPARTETEGAKAEEPEHEELAEPEPAAVAGEPEDAGEPAETDEPEEAEEPEEPRRGWFRRRRAKPDTAELDEREPSPLPSHVRVLAGAERHEADDR